MQKQDINEELLKQIEEDPTKFIEFIKPGSKENELTERKARRGNSDSSEKDRARKREKDHKSSTYNIGGIIITLIARKMKRTESTSIIGIIAKKAQGIRVVPLLEEKKARGRIETPQEKKDIVQRITGKTTLKNAKR